MKVYLYIAKQKKTLKMYLPYIEALGKKLDITHNLADADIVMILGAWTMQGMPIFHPNHTANKQGYFGTCITSPASGSTLRRLTLIVRVKPLSDTALRA